MIDFNNFEYVVGKHNEVWKYVRNKDHFIKVTPWKIGEDRRVNRFEIEKLINEGKLKQMKNKPNIHEMINSLWDTDERTWEYNGMKFEVTVNDDDNSAIKSPIHKFDHFFINRNGEKYEYTFDYRLGFFNGNIVWWNAYHYLPQVCIWQFKDINTEPTGDHSWTKIKHIKPIMNLTTNQYV